MIVFDFLSALHCISDFNGCPGLDCIFDQDLYLEPACTSGATPLPVHCNYMGIGQECRGCYMTCDGVSRYLEDFAEEYAVWVSCVAQRLHTVVFIRAIRRTAACRLWRASVVRHIVKSIGTCCGGVNPQNQPTCLGMDRQCGSRQHRHIFFNGWIVGQYQRGKTGRTDAVSVVWVTMTCHPAANVSTLIIFAAAPRWCDAPTVATTAERVRGPTC